MSHTFRDSFGDWIRKQVGIVGKMVFADFSFHVVVSMNYCGVFILLHVVRLTLGLEDTLDATGPEGKTKRDTIRTK